MAQTEPRFVKPITNSAGLEAPKPGFLDPFSRIVSDLVPIALPKNVFLTGRQNFIF